MDQSRTVRVAPQTSEPVSGGLFLLIVADGIPATHPIPDPGELIIGRAPDCDIQVDHASISRRHAILRVGEKISIEDLQSSNGTQVRGQLLGPRSQVEIAPGEPVDLGSAILIVRREAEAATRRIWTHCYFESRLEDECARAKRGESSLALLRIHIDRGGNSGIVHRTLLELTGEDDVVGAYGPKDVEVMLVDRDEAGGDALSAALREKLSARDVEVTVGVARFGPDGRGPYELMAKAGARARGAPIESDARSRVIVDESMLQLHKLIERFAAGTISVLVLGETGVGKEVIAAEVHRLSPRAKRPYLPLNCAALTETLLESELFGHEKGAFTGATGSKPGLLESADGGTVFLDEIGELPPALQAKLLRVLEERAVMRVGGLKPIPIDTRFVSATNRDLEERVEAGTFRRDLYFRLAGATVQVPPLRERVSEVEPLARAFVAEVCESLGFQAAPELSAEALSELRAYRWPGNIRELRNVIERAVLLCTHGVITRDHLPMEKMRGPAQAVAETPVPAPPAAPAPQPVAPVADSEPQTPEDTERARITAALQQCGGNQTRAAKLLGISRRTLTNRLNALGLPRPLKGRKR